MFSQISAQSKKGLVFINTNQQLPHEAVLAQETVVAALATRKEKLSRASRPKVKTGCKTCRQVLQVISGTNCANVLVTDYEESNAMKGDHRVIGARNSMCLANGSRLSQCYRGTCQEILQGYRTRRYGRTRLNLLRSRIRFGELILGLGLKAT